MKPINRFLSLAASLLGLVLLVGAASLLGACTPAATASPEPTITLLPTWTPMNPPYDPRAEPEVTATATTAPTEVAIMDNCVACHTDKDQLISTAKVEEMAEKESEGVG